MQKRWLEEDNEKISSCKDMRRSNTQKKIICILIKKKELNTLSGLQEWQNTILQKNFFSTQNHHKPGFVCDYNY